MQTAACDTNTPPCDPWRWKYFFCQIIEDSIGHPCIFLHCFSSSILECRVTLWSCFHFRITTHRLQFKACGSPTWGIKPFIPGLEVIMHPPCHRDVNILRVCGEYYHNGDTVTDLGLCHGHRSRVMSGSQCERLCQGHSVKGLSRSQCQRLCQGQRLRSVKFYSKTEVLYENLFTGLDQLYADCWFLFSWADAFWL